jgi:DNA-binding NarL/FixJ family response regulator
MTGKFKVLIVDDHPIVRHGLGELIARQDDLEVCGEAANTAEALRLVEAHHPHAAIVDISLEGESGIGLIEDLSAMHPEVKVLVSSMHDEKTFAGRALRAGALGYINKRESIRKVIEAVRQILHGQVYLSPAMANQLLRRAAVGKPLDHDPVELLSNRELQVLEMIGRGMTVQEIARRLGLSASTIETHRQKIRTKLDLNNSARLNRFAFQWVQENR